jgi:hypothetical protein
MFGLSQTEKCTEACVRCIRQGVWFDREGPDGDLIKTLKDLGYEEKTIKKAVLLAIKKNYSSNPDRVKELLEIATAKLQKI